MATQSFYPELEIESFPPVAISVEEAPLIEPVTENCSHPDFNDRSQMAQNPGKSKNQHGFGLSWNNPDGENSSKYSHEETRPEKMQERIQDLHHDMQDSLQRLQNLEAKLKNGVGKKRKRPNQADMRKNAELQKALCDIMKGTHENPSK